MTADDDIAEVLEVDSEFASISIVVDRSANGPRVCVTDRRTGASRFLDPLVIEGMVAATDEQLVAFVDPSKRWVLDDHE